MWSWFRVSKIVTAVVITVIEVSKFPLHLHIRADLFIDTVTFALADYCQHLRSFDPHPLLQMPFVLSVMGKYQEQNALYI